MPPLLLIVGGPNGAGKTTTAMHLLPNVLHIKHFVNADLIAKGLSPFAPAEANWTAAKIMVEQMQRLTEQGETFAVETTLASRSFVSVIKRCQHAGYHTQLLFIALADAELAKSRVALRVSRGGHGVPDDVVERRFHLGLKNFFEIYMKQAGTWSFAENTENGHVKIAEQTLNGEMVIHHGKRFSYYRELVKPCR